MGSIKSSWGWHQHCTAHPPCILDPRPGLTNWWVSGCAHNTHKRWQGRQEQQRDRGCSPHHGNHKQVKLNCRHSHTLANLEAKKKQPAPDPNTSLGCDPGDQGTQGQLSSSSRCGFNPSPVDLPTHTVRRIPDSNSFIPTPRHEGLTAGGVVDGIHGASVSKEDMGAHSCVERKRAG